MNYDNLTRKEAEQKLRDHDEADWSDDRLWNEVIEPADVLYWLDAFGDQSLAINCQGLPKDLPDSVVKEIDEFDVFNDWNGKVTEKECPLCNRTLYDFDFQSIHPLIDEYGDNHPRPEYISDHSGYYWDSTGEHDIMCQMCSNHNASFSRMRPEPAANKVRVFYGESDEFSQFTHQNGVIRWDFMWDIDYPKGIDLYNLTAKDDGELIEGKDVAAAFAGGTSSRDAMMERVGFEKIHVKEIDQSVKGIRRFWRYAKEVLEGWATLDSDAKENEPTHPDLPFTYIIEGKYQAWVPSQYFTKFRSELVWQSLREANANEAAANYREKYDKHLSNEWHEAHI